MLTIETVRAAQTNDLTATSAVIEATGSRVSMLANAAASKLARGEFNSSRYSEYAEEFAQIGRIAVWESLSRFEGDSVDAFYGFIYGTVEARLLDAVRDERFPASGADSDAMKVFAQMLPRAGGDPFLAEKLSQTVPPKGRRLGADRANAARISWQGTDALDAPAPDAGDDVFTSLGESLEIPADLVTSADITAEERRVKHALVNGILDVMGAGQRDVIRHSFGIGGTEDFGYGRDDNRDAELAAFLGTTVGNLRPARSKGLKAFAKRYIVAAAGTPERAEELTEAAARNLSRGVA